MKKVFALLTIVTVMSFVACKNKPAHDDKADSIRRADSIKRYNDSMDAINNATMNETPSTDSVTGDSANQGTTTGTTTTTTGTTTN